MSILDNLTPDLICLRVPDVDLGELVQARVNAILLDLDNTVCPWRSEHVSDATEMWVREATQEFRVCLVSNTTKPGRLNRVAELLGVPAVARWGLGRKPFPGGIRAGLEKIDAEPETAAIIGDQVLADVWGGNRLGLYTVWVRPIEDREFLGTKPARLIERLLVGRFRRLGLLPGGWSE